MLYKSPHQNGFFGAFGGYYIPEILMSAILSCQAGFEKLIEDDAFEKQFLQLLHHYAGRSTPLTPVKNFSQAIAGPRIFLKREDLLHTGAHKLNNALGQCLFAKKLNKTRIIAETGAGQHGVATATACAYLQLECVIYMGAKDIVRQAPNVQRMRLLGARVICVETGSKTLKDAVNEALRDWASSYETSHYCLGSALGPHPFPSMVAYFQSIIGYEAYEQCLEQTQQLPNAVIACVGGGSNAIGIFSKFIEHTAVKLIGVEAGGQGIALGENAARFSAGSIGIFHGFCSYLLQDQSGQVAKTQSISAGLDYPMVGPEHAYLHETGRAQYDSVADEAALAALKLLSKTEGIIPALESSHALAYIIAHKNDFTKDDVVIINLSGRGDKDLPELFKNHLLDETTNDA